MGFHEKALAWAVPALAAVLTIALATPALAAPPDAPTPADVRVVSDRVAPGGWTTAPSTLQTACRTVQAGGPTSIARPTSAFAPLQRVTTRSWPQAEEAGDVILVRASASPQQAPPPPPPPSGPPIAQPTWSSPAPVQLAPTPAPYYAAPVPAAAAAPCWSGCGLPCESKISMWHVRGLIGYVFYEGTDPADSCMYAGFDVGRTFCGCWGLDLFYRWNSGQFDRTGDPFIAEDGGYFHHVGIKFTWERSLGSSRFYYHVGVGPEYFWTQDYQDDDSGWGVFGELTFGYVISQNFRAFVGVNVHGVDTDVGRENPADDGEARWLWMIAPVAGIEIDF